MRRASRTISAAAASRNKLMSIEIDRLAGLAFMSVRNCGRIEGNWVRNCGKVEAYWRFSLSLIVP
jgi:hypothetical protein